MSRPPAFKKNRVMKKRAKSKVNVKKKDMLFVQREDGEGHIYHERPRPMFVDLLKKLTSRQGKIISRRKTGCTAVTQHAVADAIKRARFMALMSYVGD